MEIHQLHIKNMVCPRCIKVVSEELHALGIPIKKVGLGLVDLQKEISTADLQLVRKVLVDNGFELLENKNLILVERVKNVIIETIQSGQLAELSINFSELISKKLDLEYVTLSTLFSTIEGKTIERFIIQQKIEKIKELISYNQLTIKQIAFEMGYSSLQALSNQFKKETGVTPTEYKHNLDGLSRNTIDTF